MVSRIRKPQRGESKRRTLCPKCREIRPQTAHHIFPQGLFGKQLYGPFLYVCRQCHWEIEDLVHHRGISKDEIMRITLDWLAA